MCIQPAVPGDALECLTTSRGPLVSDCLPSADGRWASAAAAPGIGDPGRDNAETTHPPYHLTPDVRSPLAHIHTALYDVIRN